MVLRTRGLSEAERFWRHVRVLGPDDCWEWTSHCAKGGYGSFHARTTDGRRKTLAASRMSYILANGQPTNDVLHTCNNPPCCNPAHLYDGTQSQNTMDSVVAGTAVVLRKGWRNTARGERHGNAKITEGIVRDIRARYAVGDISQQKLADEYGVNQSKISGIVLRRAWAHVE